jgi:hypothetical protein
VSEEITAQIPGTTYKVKFGVEGKYYSLFLYRGSLVHKSKPLSILRGASLGEAPEEVENCLRDLLDSEEVYLSPVIIKRVVGNLMDQVPEDGTIKFTEKSQKEFVKRELKVADLIQKSDNRAGKKSIVEFTPGEETKFDATSDDIGKISVPKPKPLPEKIIKREEPVAEPTVAKPIEPVKTIEKPVEVKPEETKPIETEVVKLEEKVTTLSTEVETIQTKLEKSTQEIEDLKEQMNQIHQEKETEPQIPIDLETTEVEDATEPEETALPETEIQEADEPIVEEEAESESTEEVIAEPSIDDSEL